MTDQWKPIETAPKDGTFIQLFEPLAQPPVSVGCYDDDAGWLIGEADFMPSKCQPRCWAPLLPRPDIAPDAKSESVGVSDIVDNHPATTNPVVDHETGNTSDNDLVQRVARAMAKANGLDFDEVCGVDANPDEGYCDSSTCVAAYGEDHDAEQARRLYLHLAQAAIAAMRAHLVPVAWQRRQEYSDIPGYVPQWQAVSKAEATSHFDRREGYEYRPLCAMPGDE